MIQNDKKRIDNMKEFLDKTGLEYLISKLKSIFYTKGEFINTTVSKSDIVTALGYTPITPTEFQALVARVTTLESK